MKPSAPVTSEDIHQWFVRACRRGAVPRAGDPEQFASHLNRHCALKPIARVETPCELLEYRDAVRRLRRAVPPIIAHAEQVLRNYRAEYDASETTTAFNEERSVFEEKRLERL
jgi:hypothetical protein